MTQRPFEVDHRGMTLRGTVYLPHKAGRHPTLLLLHRFTGNRMEAGFMFVRLGRALADRGVVAVTFDFLHSGESDGSFEKMLPSGELADALRMTQWTQAQPYVDRARLGLLGFSLGGLIAACASAQNPPAFKALVLVAPTTVANLCRHAGDSEACTPAQTPVLVGPHALHEGFFADLQKLDPLGAIVRHPRPTLLVQGTGDTAVAPAVSMLYVEAMRKAGIPVDHRLVPDADHNFVRVPHQQELVRSVVEWVTRTL